ncbi:MAG: hypothetical protein JRJ85_06860 [Deltaproteobacteria bacterium]|nr:hypothetical protein [Deltaproteobacteria bacterium]
MQDIAVDHLSDKKLPGKDTGIEVKKTICSICAVGTHCGIDAYVKDGTVVKVEGTKEHPHNAGTLCSKGAASRQYIYNKDRILTPLRRTGKRGSGKFEPISGFPGFKSLICEVKKL